MARSPRSSAGPAVPQCPLEVADLVAPLPFLPHARAAIPQRPLGRARPGRVRDARPGRDRSLPGGEAGPRAHLLGPGFRARPARLAQPGSAARRGEGERAEGGRAVASIEHADEPHRPRRLAITLARLLLLEQVPMPE